MPVNAYVTEPIEELIRDADPDGTLAPCGLRRLVIGPGALAAIAPTVIDLLGAGYADGPGRTTRVSLLVDKTPIMLGGEDVKELAEAQLAEYFNVTRTVLDDGHGELHVVDSILDDATNAVADHAAVVAIGGGNISDIAKVAVQRAGEGAVPPVLVTVQTAASVDGFTDDVSVLLRDGVKRTVPSCWPDAVVSDTGVIAEAPETMNRAGFGEMTSMLVAPADWRLASLIGTDTTYKPNAIRLLGSVGRNLESWAPGVRQGESGAVASLARALALRGIVTGVAGTTAVLSGVEHLFSHMLDQHHAERRLPMGLHGAQVGAGSVIAASAWEMLFDRLGSGTAQPTERALDQDQARRRVMAAFESVDPSLRVAEECWKDYSAKLTTVTANWARVQALVDGWAGHRDELRSLFRPAASIAAALHEAGAATTPADLDPRVDSGLARWAVENCALMRNRFTVVDLLTLLGWWAPADVDEVLERAARAVPAPESRKD